jgi:hypothetical protein
MDRSNRPTDHHGANAKPKGQADREAARPQGGPSKRNWAVGAAVFLVLLGVYHLNGDFQMSNDAKPNMYLPITLLREGNLSFTPDEMPFMFVWWLETPQGAVAASFRRWDEELQGRTAAELRRAGLLGQAEPRYYVIPSVRTDAATGQRLYVNTFGPGAGLAALPVFALLHAVAGDLADNPRLMNYAGKFVSVVMVAGSAALIFLTVARFTSAACALLVAAAYGLGTCVWSISSQALWQHGPNEFFLALGTLFLIRLGRGQGRWKDAALCGLAYSAAVVCRPTSLVVAAAAGVYLLIAARRLVLTYVLAALPLGLALAAYNTYYLGSPLKTGQGEAGKVVARQKTGSQALWQTPLAEGTAGLMVSPSRGLLVFSPWVIFALGGAAAAWWRRGAFAPLMGLTLGTLGLLVIAFKWFDWWGGWCFGYRPIVDTMPLLAVMLVPAMNWICRKKAALVTFLVLLAWSVTVQVLGAWAYNLETWNAPVSAFDVYLPGEFTPEVVADSDQVQRIAATRPVEYVNPITADIDKPQHRRRLWSLTDNQIRHLMASFTESRRVKHREMEDWLRYP